MINLSVIRDSVAKTYRLHVLDILLLLLNHGLEIYIHFDTHGVVVSFSLTALFLNVIHSFATLLSVDLQLFDLVET